MGGEEFIVPFEDTPYNMPNKPGQHLYERDFRHALLTPEEIAAEIAAEEAQIDLFNDELPTNVSYLSDRAAEQATPGRIVEAQPQYENEQIAEVIPFDIARIRHATENIVRVRRAA